MTFFLGKKTLISYKYRKIFSRVIFWDQGKSVHIWGHSRLWGCFHNERFHLISRSKCEIARIFVTCMSVNSCLIISLLYFSVSRMAGQRRWLPRLQATGGGM